ncbi:hypothetical protein ACLMJK_005577 [Lecanora helva]
MGGNTIIYNDEQISRYLDHISLPRESRDLLHTPTRLHHPPNALKFLTSLQQHQLCTVPFENLSLHYSPHHSISLDPHHLYKKIVEHGRGGYCMENNCFFATVLRSLGFRLHSAGARVSFAAEGEDEEVYAGWSHMVNIVTLDDGKKYMLDVGFGNNGPIQPLPLDPQHSQVKGIKPAEMQLVYQNLSLNSDPDQNLWFYQHRNDSDAKWVPMYCFTELEFLPQDYEIMNFWTSQSRKSWFTTKIVVVRTLMRDEETFGSVVLIGGELKRRVEGKTEHLKTCEKEEERVEILEKWFGVRLAQEERAGIKGLVTELKS